MDGATTFGQSHGGGPHLNGGNNMNQTMQTRTWVLRGLLTAALAGVMLAAAGCEVDSWMDPSVVGRWERTPVVMPILDQLDIIDEPPAKAPGTIQVQSEDLIDTVQEYVIGAGDLITFTVFELIIPNVETVQTRRVDDLGIVRLPVIGAINIAGLTPSQVEKQIARVLEDMDHVKDAEVSVIVQEGRQNTYSVIGEPRVAGTGIGTYVIPHPNFRILEAMALARGIPGQIKTIYVIREANYVQPRVARADITMGSGMAARGSGSQSTSDLIDRLTMGIDSTAGAPGDGNGNAAMNVLASGLDNGGGDNRWVYVDGKWVKLDSVQPQPRPATSTMAELAPAGSRAPRILEIPYDRLLNGDMRYNVVVRPGDVIRVPAPVIGNVYVGGAINRPGTYALPGDKDLTLKQLVFAAGNLSPIAIPERVDLIRRVGDDQEATLRLNLRAIFNGEQPDFYLKPNDTINVGTNFIAPPLAVIRNGFRMSYGFGFVLDRNFEREVFGDLSR